MSSLTPYLFFEGRCDEAIALYRQALGAELSMRMRYDENPDAPPPDWLPPGSGAKVMHATLRVGAAELMLSDGGCSGQLKFEGVRVAHGVADEAAAKHAFNALAEGGKIEMPLMKTFWSPSFGMVTDCFGVGWMIMVDGSSGSA